MKNTSPIVLRGKPAAPGIGMGTVCILQSETEAILPSKIASREIPGQIDKFNRALKTLREQYLTITELPGNKEVHHIIQAQIQTLDDPELHAGIIRKIEEIQLTAEYAIFSEFNNYIQLLGAASADWAEERVIDLISIRDDLIEITRDRKKNLNVKEGDIIFAEDIAPAMMVTLSHLNIGGIVLKKGGFTSHAVILSQSLGIPCVINVTWDRFQLQADADAVVDGNEGQVIVYPDADQKKDFNSRKEREREQTHEMLTWAKKPGLTRCGHPFTLRANVEFLDELPRIEQNGACGIGLLRTETVLFETKNFDVEKQVEFYSQVVKAAGKNPVTIRLFDAGGDKILESSDSEANPFLGWRGVRMLLDQKDILEKQLEAIYRTSAGTENQIEILIPMVSHAEEVLRVKEISREVIGRLNKEGVDFNEHLPIGVMVEVPSVALMADHFAEIADFFSIGTNDLTQYTLAVDRGNEKISDLFDNHHPALWRLIKMTLDAARARNIPVSVCGEMAGGADTAACLIGMGFSELSMNPGSIPLVKKTLSRYTYKNLRKLAENILQASTTNEIKHYFRAWNQHSR